jgi:hypothetical protein
MGSPCYLVRFKQQQSIGLAIVAGKLVYLQCRLATSLPFNVTCIGLSSNSPHISSLPTLPNLPHLQILPIPFDLLASEPVVDSTWLLQAIDLLKTVS